MKFDHDEDGELFFELPGTYAGALIIYPILWVPSGEIDIVVYDTTRPKKDGLIYQSNQDMDIGEAYVEVGKIALGLFAMQKVLIG